MKLNAALALSVLLSASSAVAQTNAVENVASAYTRFGFHLLTECRASLPKANYFLSPAGLAFALSMTLNGADGATLNEIISTLGLTNISVPTLNDANKTLLTRLASLDSKIQLEIADSIWIDQKASIKPPFIAVNQSGYLAQVASANFADPTTVNTINNWVNTRTRGKIPSIFGPRLDPDLRLVLLNAIYFKGDWQEPFDQKLTHDLPFTLTNGQTVLHPRMTRAGKYRYCEQEGFQAVELPYAGGAVSMFVFLPAGGLSEFLKSFGAADFDTALSRVRMRKGTVELPRFKLENEYFLTQVLSRMGMPLAFSQGAEFQGMSDEPLRLSVVKQKTFVAVNEQGTEAAAVTAVGARPMAVFREPPPFQFTVDRPFFIAIREKQTGIILFLGAINDPR